MKYIFLFFACTVVFCKDVLAQSTKGNVILTGNVRNFNNQVEVQDMSEMGDLLLPVADRFFVPDAAGNFKVKFPLASPNYFRVGRNILYLSPGDSLTVFIDYKDPKLAIFSGRHSGENEYLRETPFPKGGSFLEAGTKIKRTTDSTVAVIEEIAKKRTEALNSYQDLSPEFVKLETARIRADLLNSFAAINAYFPMRFKLSKDSAEIFRKNFATEIAPYMERYNKNFLDADFLKLVVYRDVVDELIAKETKTSKPFYDIKGWMAARDMAQELKKASDRETKIKFEERIKNLSSPIYKSALSNTLDKVLLLSNGDMAYDFTAADNNNTIKQLATQKGKLIYIDIWATWCGPCMEEMPAYEKLKESYKNNPNISFISLSIDDDKDAWKKNMQKRNAAGLQWIIDRAKMQPYNIISIPRSILVDKDFHIVEMNAALPSSKSIHDTLDKLLM